MSPWIQVRLDQGFESEVIVETIKGDVELEELLLMLSSACVVVDSKCFPVRRAISGSVRRAEDDRILGDDCYKAGEQRSRS